MILTEKMNTYVRREGYNPNAYKVLIRFITDETVARAWMTFREKLGHDWDYLQNLNDEELTEWLQRQLGGVVHIPCNNVFTLLVTDITMGVLYGGLLGFGVSQAICRNKKLSLREVLLSTAVGGVGGGIIEGRRCFKKITSSHSYINHKKEHFKNVQEELINGYIESYADDLFLKKCPISQLIIQECAISPGGTYYDYTSILQSSRDENGLIRGVYRNELFSEENIRKDLQVDIIAGKRIRHLLNEDLAQASTDGDRESLNIMINYFDEKLNKLWVQECKKIIATQSDHYPQAMEAFHNKCGGGPRAGLNWEQVVI